MPTLPTELITLFGSSLLSAFFRILGAILQSKKQQHMLTMQALNVKAGIINEARRYNNSHFQWTRRLIALGCVFFIIVFPKLVAVFMPHAPIHVGYGEMSQSFWPFTSSLERIKWVSLKGLIISPLDTHMVCAIIGLYFGGSLVGNK